jgi:hypothetical protein
MKNKAILLLTAVAVVTLSFTFVNTSEKSNKSNTPVSSTQGEPVGGFAADEIVK